MSYPKLAKEAKAKTFLCLKCEKKFSTKFSMQRHSKDCGVEPKRVECERCKKSLKNSETLEKHQVVCFGLSKKLVCNLCDELFCSAFSLRRHLWRFHQGEELPVPVVEQVQKQETGKSINKEIDIRKKENGTKDKKILNFVLAKSAREEKINFRYYMDVVCYDYECLEDEVDASQFEKPVIYPLTKP